MKTNIGKKPSKERLAGAPLLRRMSVPFGLGRQVPTHCSRPREGGTDILWSRGGQDSRRSRVRHRFSMLADSCAAGAAGRVFRL